MSVYVRVSAWMDMLLMGLGVAVEEDVGWSRTSGGLSSISQRFLSSSSKPSLIVVTDMRSFPSTDPDTVSEDERRRTPGMVIRSRVATLSSAGTVV